MNILLHICCAPCAIFPVEEMRRGSHRAAGFFYNPNIHPYSEYIKRREGLESYSKNAGLNVIYGDYEIEEYFRNIVYDEAMKDRCPACWRLRLKKTAGAARDNGFDAFTTTLLASPYQDHEVVRRIGEDVAGSAGMKFYYRDFRPGFRQAHEKARAMGVYCQNYCGCLFSEKKRMEKKGQRK